MKFWTGFAASLSDLPANVAESPVSPRSPSHARRLSRPVTVPDAGVTKPESVMSADGRSPDWTANSPS